jgi:hypothetical protein
VPAICKSPEPSHLTFHTSAVRSALAFSMKISPFASTANQHAQPLKTCRGAALKSLTQIPASGSFSREGLTR